jgi:hypothetical protein
VSSRRKLLLALCAVGLMGLCISAMFGLREGAPAVLVAEQRGRLFVLKV